MGEKSPLPAIVVTPSSPSCSADFSVAFLAPAEKPTVTAKERLFSFAAPLNLKARTTFFLLLLLFIMACHLFTHRLAASHPHLQFGMMPGVAEEAQANHIGGFNWKAFGVSRLPTSTANANSLSMDRLECNVYHDATQPHISPRRNRNYLNVPFVFFSSSSGTPGCLNFKIDYSLFMPPCEKPCISGIAIIPNHTSTRVFYASKGK